MPTPSQSQDSQAADVVAIPLPQAQLLLTSFTSFLTISIHSILYYRNIYPPQTFLSTRAYNLPVHQNRHPAVCAWIQDAVAAVQVQLAAGVVSRVAVAIHAPNQFEVGVDNKSKTSRPADSDASTAAGAVVLERWIFDVSRFPAWPAMKDPKGKSKEEDAPPLQKGAGAGGDSISVANDASLDAVNWVDVDESLRAALRRIAYAAETSPSLPAGCTFTVAVELRDEAPAPTGVSGLSLRGHCCHPLTSSWDSIPKRGYRPSQINSRLQDLNPSPELMSAVLLLLLFDLLPRVLFSSSAGLKRARRGNHLCSKNLPRNHKVHNYHELLVLSLNL
jgi:mitotic spindle assembly checkpoint protein MAD2B